MKDFLHSCIHEKKIVQSIGATFGYNYSHVCTQKKNQKNFPYHEAITKERVKSVNWCYHFKMGVGP